MDYLAVPEEQHHDFVFYRITNKLLVDEVYRDYEKRILDVQLMTVNGWKLYLARGSIKDNLKGNLVNIRCLGNIGTALLGWEQFLRSWISFVDCLI